MQYFKNIIIILILSFNYNIAVASVPPIHEVITLTDDQLNPEIVGEQRSQDPQYEYMTERTKKIADNIYKQLKCVICDGQSLYESFTPFSNQIKQQVLIWILASSDDLSPKEIEINIITILGSLYGEKIRLTPQFKNLSTIIWLVPMLLFSMIFLIVIRLKLKDHQSSQ